MDTIKTLQRVAAAQASKNPKEINKVCAELADYVLKNGYSGTEEFLEPLAILARAATDVKIRIRANRAIARFSDRKDKEQKPAIVRFLADVASLPDFRERFDLYVAPDYNDETIGCAAEFPRAVARAALDLAGQFPVAERFQAYERVRKYVAFKMDDIEQDVLAAIFKEAKDLSKGAKKIDAYWNVIYSIKDEKTKTEAIALYLDAVSQTSTPLERAKKCSFLASLEQVPVASKKMALDYAFRDIEKIRGLEDRAERYRFVLSKFPDLSPYAQMAAAGASKIAGQLSDSEARTALYRLIARSSAGGEGSEAVAGFVGEVGRMRGVDAKTKACTDMIRNTKVGSALREASIRLWREAIEKLPAQKRVSALCDEAHSYFSLSEEDFRTVYKAVFEGALKDLPDAEARTNACIDLALAAQRYACDLENFAIEGFRKHLNGIPDKKRRMNIAGSLLSEEQTMLQPPPLEAAASDEFIKLAGEARQGEEATKAALLKAIRAQAA